MKTLMGLAGLTMAGFMLLSCNTEVKEANYQIIPLPQEISVMDQAAPFILSNGTKIMYPEGNEKMQKNAEFLASYIKDLTGKSLAVQAGTDGKGIILQLGGNAENPEGYQLKVTSDQVVISGPTEAGVFYGIQTLRKSIPVAQGVDIALPAVEINDYPRFSYRGAMLDVSRHFFPVDSVKRFIDMLALHNINRFHWHLSEDQGWRIEIKSRPELTEIGSKRAETVIGHNSGKYDGKPYGGFFTQEEAKEIVAYAAERHITVIPEIDMPGHMQAALAAYPNLGCTGGPYEVWKIWGVSEDVLCAGNDETLKFIEDVLGEIIQIFPSEYIHVGGDECPKVRWAKCPKCQARIKALGLKSDKNHTAEERLQSFIINHAEKFLNGHGRQIIGWDEILEGGLAPNATVMSWRGEEGGIIAARQKHKVIMTPSKRCYIDYYQESPEYAPLAIGGFLPLDSVYFYNPLPAGLTTEEQSYIIGTQANIWGEYIQTPEAFEYMAFPRLLAMSEVQWTQPEYKDFVFFTRRLDKEFKRLDYCQVNSCRNFYEVNYAGVWNENHETYEVALSSFCPDAEIHYAINDSVITASSSLYKSPILLSKDAVIYAAVYKEGKSMGRVTHKEFAINKATGCDYKCGPKTEWEHLDESFGLTDGYCGYAQDMRRWVSFYQDSVQIVVELKGTQRIKQVAFASLWRPWNMIWPAKAMSVSVSADGKNFFGVGNKVLSYDFTLTESTRFPASLSFPEVEATFVRLDLLSGGLCPKGYFNEGEQSRLAIDEIEIN